jgi:hypothetical protein
VSCLHKSTDPPVRDGLFLIGMLWGCCAAFRVLIGRPRSAPGLSAHLEPETRPTVPRKSGHMFPHLARKKSLRRLSAPPRALAARLIYCAFSEAGACGHVAMRMQPWATGSTKASNEVASL